VDAAPYNLRLASAADIDRIRAAVRRTLNNPEGKSGRKTYADAVDRGELLVLTRRERDGSESVDAFIEWHSRVDGPVTIRDAGSTGDEPNAGHVKRLVRELLRMARPPSATVKVDADLAVWNEVFSETPGFVREGQEYSRPKYKNIWTWTPAAEQLMLERMRASQPTRPARFEGPRPGAPPRPAPPFRAARPAPPPRGAGAPTGAPPSGARRRP
jgi:hypothetical protein